MSEAIAAATPEASSGNVATTGSVLGTPAKVESTWRDSLPEGLKDNPSIQKYKSVDELAKGYVNAQALIGKKGIEAPDEKWDVNQWNDFYNKLGRPESSDKYDFKDVKVPEGYEVDEGMKKSIMDSMHARGLSNKQAKELYADYLGYTGGAMKQMESTTAEARTKGIDNLKQEWGSSFESKIGDAQKAVKAFGGDEMAKWLNDTRLGDEPNMIRFFSNLGVFLKQDSATGSGNSGFTVSTQAAKAELDSLRLDSDFQKALNTRNHPGHAVAVQRQLDLIRVLSS